MASNVETPEPSQATSLPTPPNIGDEIQDRKTTTANTPSLSTLINTRRSTRAFLPTPVPASDLHYALKIAQFAASNSNIQPWRLFISTGPAKDRLRDALVAEAARRPPILDTSLPDEYKPLRSAMGAELYGPRGYNVARDDEAGRKAYSARNYAFFDAPLAGIVCIDRRLHDQDVLSVGIYLQTFMLALTEKGLGSCMQVSIAGYEDVVREVLGLKDEIKVLCGFAVGYPDPESPLNRLVRERQPVDKHVVLLED